MSMGASVVVGMAAIGLLVASGAASTAAVWIPCGAAGGLMVGFLMSKAYRE